MMKPLVLVTGTSSGIGLAAAIACARAGFEVIATLRNFERRAALDHELHRLAAGPEADRAPRVHIEQLDVTAAYAGDKVRELLLKYGPIEYLVNAAGVAVGGVFEEQSDLDVRDQFETNVFGVMTVTRALLPAMRAAGRGRIVNVSSIAGRFGIPGLSTYAASKHALEGFSDSLRHELAPFGIQVCLVELGGIHEPLQRRAELADEDGPYAYLTRMVKRTLLAGGEADGATAAGAKVARLLLAPEPPFRSLIGRGAKAMAAWQRVAPDALFSTTLRRLMGL
jgi:NAD(P)-dependent dehydrogenase (short-subunit alcohol dehydrogenase family)